MMREQIIRRTLRIPTVAGPTGDGAAVARQLDAVLVGAGFSASREVLEHVSGLQPGTAMDLAVDVLGAVRALVGDHVEHNPYFIDFPAGVPDTVEFWLTCLREAVAAGDVRGEQMDASMLAGVDLLGLPAYGTYQHTYAQMLAVHDELVRSAGDRITMLHLGGSLAAETRALYEELAGSRIPLGEADLALLCELAGELLDEPCPQSVPVRQNRAVLNAVRLAAGRPLVAIDTVTDLLRLACHSSDGDVSLREPTRFRPFRRAERRVLLAALDQVVADSPDKLSDVARYARRWQRLGERLHPHEYDLPHAREVFAVARGSGRSCPWAVGSSRPSAPGTPAVPSRSSVSPPACCCASSTGYCGSTRRSTRRRSPPRYAPPPRRRPAGCCVHCANIWPTGPHLTPFVSSPTVAGGPGSRRTVGRRWIRRWSRNSRRSWTRS